MLLLDDGTDEILDTERVSDYRPVLTFAAYGEWTHGYRTTSAPVIMASVNRSLSTTLGEPSPQRSRSASLLAFNAGFCR
jgi:hypothetical protein